jgi:phage terminase small subunit
MGLRGPLRDPHSLRGQQEGIQIDAPERPDTPKWLDGPAKKIFRSLLDDLVAARVPVKKVDGHAIAMAANCIWQAQKWTEHEATQGISREFQAQCAQLVARFQRDAQEWLSVIGGTPKSRAQMGLRGQEKKAAPAGPMAVLQMRQKA